MTESDVPFAIGLTGKEKWSNTNNDFERLIRLNPIGNFVAMEGEIRVGIITTAIFGKLAFMGNLITARKYRGHGIGRRLIERALSFLKKHHLSAIELDGDFPAVELYRKLGFRDKYFSLRFHRRAANSQLSRRKISADFIAPEVIAQFDKRMTGLVRNRFIREFADFHNGHVYVNNSDKSGGIEAYSIVRESDDHKFLIGPTISKTPQKASILMESIIDDYCSYSIFAGVPEINRPAVDIMLKNGFCYGVPSLRMYMGDKLNYEKNIYAIIAGDVG